jgi:hypothetical protein
MRSVEERTNEKIRKESGHVNHTDPLVSFLYILMRDHLPTGTVEGIVTDHCIASPSSFTNGWLAKYAINLAESLRKLG